MSPLQHFTLTSDPLVYAGGIAPVVFPNRPRCRAAIIKVTAKASNPRIIHRNLFTSFRVEGTEHVQGAGFPVSLLTPTPGPEFDELSGGTPAAALAALTNTSALTVTEITGAENVTLKKRVRQEGIHTWAGGADTGDVIPVVGLAETDIILLTIVAAGAGPVSAVRAAHGVDEITLTTTGNGEDGVTKIAYQVIIPANVDAANEADIAAQLAIQRTFNAAVMNALATLGSAGDSRDGYLPGSLLRLHDGRTVGGIRLPERHSVSMTVQDLTEGSAEIDRIVLHCVAFPRKGRAGAAANALWERFSQGEGHVSLYGQSLAFDAAGVTVLSQQAEPRHGQNPLRRLRVRAHLHDASFNILESEMRELRAELYTASQRAPHDTPAPAREVIGHPGYDHHIAQVDLERNEAAQVRVHVGSAPAAERTLRMLTILEGRDPEEEFIGTAEDL